MERIESAYRDGVAEAGRDSIHGPGAVNAAWDKIQRRRRAAYYDAWVTEQRSAEHLHDSRDWNNNTPDDRAADSGGHRQG